jgi:putative MATE family efflux protein
VSELRRIAAIAVPAIAEVQASEATRTVALLLLRDLGPAVITGVGLTHHLVQTAQMAFLGIATGCVAVAAQAIGAGRAKLAGLAAAQTWTVSLLVGLALTAAFEFFGTEMLRALGAAPDAIQAARGYARWQGGAVLALSSATAQAAALRAVGDAVSPLKYHAAGQAVHLALLPPLVRGWLPVPWSGAAGAGLAAFAGACVTAVLVHRAWRRRLGLRDLRAAALVPDGPTLRLVLGISLPAMGERVVLTIGQLSFIRAVAAMGTVTYAAHQLALLFSNIIFTITYGAGIAATVLAGQYIGAGRPRQAVRAAMTAGHLALGFGLLTTGAATIFATPLARNFTTDAMVVALVPAAMPYMLAYQLPVAYHTVWIGALQGAGDTRWTLFISLIGIWPVRLGLVAVLWFAGAWTLQGAWLALGVDFAVRSVIAGRRFASDHWRRSLAMPVSAREREGVPARDEMDAAAAPAPRSAE